MDKNQDIKKLTDAEIEKTDIESVAAEPLTAQPEKNERRPKNKKRLLIIVTLVAVLVIAGGIAAYFILNQNDTKDSKANDKSKVVEKEKVASFTPQNAIDAVKIAIESQYPDVRPEGSDLTGDQIYYKISDSAPYWKVPGVKFYVNYKGMGAGSLEIYTSYNSADSNKARGTAVVNTIQESLTEKGFVESTGNAYSDEYSMRTAFIKDDVICLTSSLDDNSVYNIPLTISCGNVSKYTSDLDTYKESKPFADAYLASEKTIEEGSTFGFSSEKVSATPGYRTANAGMSNVGSFVGGAMGLFYKKDGGNWIYFKATQQMLMCEDYNTVDLKAAYKGEICMVNNQADNYTESIVQ